MEASELRAALEAILFVSHEPVSVDDLADAFPGVSKDQILVQLDELKKNVDSNISGFVLEQTAGGWRFASRPEHDATLKKFFSKKGESRLSMAALETMAIIAYRQPVTAPEVSDIRGVNSTGVIRTLLERRMIRVAGRKNVVGSPFLYRTTREFLVHFGLNDVRDLPRLEEFGDLIGESINDDVVMAIHESEGRGATTDAYEEEPTSSGEEFAAATESDDAGSNADRVASNEERSDDADIARPAEAATRDDNDTRDDEHDGDASREEMAMETSESLRTTHDDAVEGPDHDVIDRPSSEDARDSASDTVESIARNTRE